MAARSTAGTASATGATSGFYVSKGPGVIEVTAIGGAAVFDLERTSDNSTWRKVDDGGSKFTRSLASGDSLVVPFEEVEAGDGTNSAQIRLNFTTLGSTASWRLAQ